MGETYSTHGEIGNAYVLVILDANPENKELLDMPKSI